MTIEVSPEFIAWYKNNYGGIESVPKKYWTGVLKAVNPLDSVDCGHGTHCWNTVYLLNGWLYDLVFEIDGSRPIDITRKKA